MIDCSHCHERDQCYLLLSRLSQQLLLCHWTLSEVVESDGGGLTRPHLTTHCTKHISLGQQRGLVQGAGGDGTEPIGVGGQ